MTQRSRLAGRQAPDPSWFFENAQGYEPEPEIGFTREAAAPRSSVKRAPLPARRPAPPSQWASAPPRRRSIPLGHAMAMAAAMALVSGAAAAVINAKGHDFASAVMSYLQPPPPAAAPPASAASPKTIAMATLDVGDASGRTNALIPLALHAEPAVSGDDMMLKISGLPDKAYLTTGQRAGIGDWTLSLDDLRDVKLIVPKSTTPELMLDVTAIDTKSGQIAAPVESLIVALSDVKIEPASAPPPLLSGGKVSLAVADPRQPAAIPLPVSIGGSASIAQGDQLWGQGDVAAARQAYQAAWAKGDGRGALALGRSYDPLAAGHGADANADQAVAWYQRAAEAGEPDALKAIVRLRLKP